MRTTVKLDDDLHRALERQARKLDRPFKQVLNDVVRAGLAMTRQPAKAAAPYRAKVVDLRLLPGIDPTRLNHLADELEMGEALAHLRKRA